MFLVSIVVQLYEVSMRLINRTKRHVWFRGFVQPFGFSETGLVMNQDPEEVFGPPIPKFGIERCPLDGEVVIEEVARLLTMTSSVQTKQSVMIRPGKITTLKRMSRFGGYEGVQLCDFADDFEELCRRIVVSA